MAQSPEPVVLSFAQTGDPQEFRLDLSAVVQIGTDLWLGTDEGTRLARLRPDGQGGYGDVSWYPLAELLDLPGGDAEIDVEGLAEEDEALWLVGSHSPRRQDADSEESEQDQLRGLGRVKRSGNRYTLARLPLAREAGSAGLVPARGARLAGGRRRNLLTDALRNDKHLGRFLRIPGKDNGFNVEGLAAAGGHLFVGLRGPVLEGWAVILVIAPEPDPDDDELLRLGRVGSGKRTYSKVFLDIQGLGIRDLHFDGTDLLILAGPTMKLRSDAVVVRWRDAARAGEDMLVSRDRLEHVLDLPYGSGGTESVDHPEGIALLGEGRDRSLLVVYDSPNQGRRHGSSGIMADQFRLLHGM
ncbi:MAG: hypothetical protein K0S19_1470 [Geminicoccaceae bacterium]|nr:hypothetical protein [Geminicoccaceae bacterium]